MKRTIAVVFFVLLAFLLISCVKVGPDQYLALIPVSVLEWGNRTGS